MRKSSTLSGKRILLVWLKQTCTKEVFIPKMTQKRGMMTQKGKGVNQHKTKR